MRRYAFQSTKLIVPPMALTEGQVVIFCIRNLSSMRLLIVVGYPRPGTSSQNRFQISRK